MFTQNRRGKLCGGKKQLVRGDGVVGCSLVERSKKEQWLDFTERRTYLWLPWEVKGTGRMWVYSAYRKSARLGISKAGVSSEMDHWRNLRGHDTQL